MTELNPFRILRNRLAISYIGFSPENNAIYTHPDEEMQISTIQETGKQRTLKPQSIGSKVATFTLMCLCFNAAFLKAEDPTTKPSKPHFSRLPDRETGIDFVSPLIPDHPYAYLYHSGMTCSGIATGDLNGDDRPDLFLANGPGKNKLYLQTGEGIRFTDVTQVAGVGLGGGDNWAAGVAMADVDNDGDTEMVIGSIFGGLYASENSNEKGGEPVWENYQPVNETSGKPLELNNW